MSDAAIPPISVTPVTPAIPVMRTLALLSAAWLAACGGSSAPPPAPPAAVIATPRLTADDVEVARVNGRPVWASCVAAQARATAAASSTASGTTDQQRAGALDQCIAFELLAQAAEARGLADTREVAEATRAAAVNRLVATEFEQRYRTPDDLKKPIDLLIARNERRMHIAPQRSSAYARFIAPKDAPPELDARAHALADRLAAELAGETGLYGTHLADAAARVAAGSDLKLETSDVKPTRRDDLVEPYAQALYAIPEVGRIAPAVRTPWGWDVVLWTGGIEARELSRAELVAELFPEMRRRQFQLWVTQLGKQLGVHIEVDQAAVEKLDTEGPP
jgi:hypothetical protein